ncbi:MAG: hypothetical protein LBL58_10145 [Tannerellaceae bacterium]|jgi:hypothetical protein|nr:hypothetical protein [Tannerellaceae bacterium]
MKRKVTLFLRFAVLLVLGMVFVGCSSDDGGGGGIQITQLQTNHYGTGTILLDVGIGLSQIDGTNQNELIESFEVTSNNIPIDVGVVGAFGAIVNGVSQMELYLFLSNEYTFTSGTAYAIKVKYTKRTTPITFDNGSELGNFEIEKTITAESFN